MSIRFGSSFAACVLAVFLGTQSAHAQSAEQPEVQQERGAVTNLPIPRFVSLKGSEGNVRRGPSLRHRIDWVFKQRGMPLRVIGEFEHWRQVQDRDGVGGWVHYSLLSGVRTAIVDNDLMPLYSRADPESQINAYLEAGVVARIESCGPVWCRLKADGIRGWTLKDAIWGVGADEEVK
ncbi:SH3 domain-containing protein [Gelidibacter sp. F2691]|nr:SH3 domain-containing protein [Gelidibacter sp. F2691]